MKNADFKCLKIQPEYHFFLALKAKRIHQQNKEKFEYFYKKIEIYLT